MVQIGAGQIWRWSNTPRSGTRSRARTHARARARTYIHVGRQGRGAAVPGDAVAARGLCPGLDARHGPGASRPSDTSPDTSPAGHSLRPLSALPPTLRYPLSRIPQSRPSATSLGHVPQSHPSVTCLLVTSLSHLPPSRPSATSLVALSIASLSSNPHIPLPVPRADLPLCHVEMQKGGT